MVVSSVSPRGLRQRSALDEKAIKNNKNLPKIRKTHCHFVPKTCDLQYFSVFLVTFRTENTAQQLPLRSFPQYHSLFS
jgi:hypothetical protein